MALLWFDGFEGYGTSTGSAVSDLDIKYTTSSGDAAFTLRTGRVSGLAVQTDAAGGFLQTPTFTGTTSIVVGVAFKRNFHTTNLTFLTLREGSTTHLQLRCNSNTGEFRFISGGGSIIGIDTIGAAPPAGTWCYIEIVATIDDSAGTLEFWMNGVRYINLSGVDTRNGGTGVIDNVRLQSLNATNGDWFIDDWYVLNTSGSVNNARLGSHKVVGLLPAADGTVEQWMLSTGTDSYALCDENPPNGDTDYIESGTSGQATRFTYATLSDVASVKGVHMSSTVRETDASPYSIYQQVKSGATTSDGSSTAIGGTSFSTKTRLLETDPNTSSLWTVANINAAEFGIKVV